MDLSPVERFVVVHVFRGADAFAHAVRGGLRAASAIERRHTGTGFFVTIRFAQPLPLESARSHWDVRFTHSMSPRTSRRVRRRPERSILQHRAMQPSLNLLVLRCADIDASGRFYEALGFSFVREQHGSGPEHLAGQLGDFVLELYPATEERVTHGLRIGFYVLTLEAVLQRLESVGGRVRTRTGRGAAIVEDLDGHVLELSERPSGA